jgi:hypothetical protein
VHAPIAASLSLDRRLDPDATARYNIVIASNVAVLLLSRSRFKKLARPCSWRSALVWWTLLATSPSYSGLLPQRRHCLHCGHAARVGFKKLVRLCSWRSAGLVAAAPFVVVARPIPVSSSTSSLPLSSPRRSRQVQEASATVLVALCWSGGRC